MQLLLGCAAAEIWGRGGLGVRETRVKLGCRPSRLVKLPRNGNRARSDDHPDRNDATPPNNNPARSNTTPPHNPWHLPQTLPLPRSWV